MNQTAVRWNNVSYFVRSGFWLQNKTILSGLDLELPWGTVLGLVGPNGAGKTTSIKLGAGIIEPDRGEVLVNNYPACSLAAKSSISILTEIQYFYPNLKVSEWLYSLAQMSGLSSRQIQEGLDLVLDSLELGQLFQKQMHTLSKGQLQRTGLAQALMQDPDILLLDEPMSGLDPYWRYRFKGVLKQQRERGKTILLSTHILNDIEDLCDRIALMENCRVRWTGAISELSRKIKGYEVVARINDPDIVNDLATEGSCEQKSTGEYVFLIPSDKREYILDLVTRDRLELTSLSPVHQDLEELLFEISD